MNTFRFPAQYGWLRPRRSQRSGANDTLPATPLPEERAVRPRNRFSNATNPVPDARAGSPGEFTAVSSLLGGTRAKSPTATGRGRLTSVLSVVDSPDSRAGT